jgi:hypothetical protein
MAEGARVDVCRTHIRFGLGLDYVKYGLISPRWPHRSRREYPTSPRTRRRLILFDAACARSFRAVVAEGA